MRKAAVIISVRSGAISLDEACDRYALSAEEFFAWEDAFDSNGVGGLRRYPSVGSRSKPR
jgi:Protein of unknown function (DUF1153)